MAAPDISGARFGSLLVVSREPNDKSGSSMWLCLCDCGEKRVVAGTGLRAGRNKSCGCKSPRFKPTWDYPARSDFDKRTRSIFIGMHSRCSPKAKGKSLRLYYESGITVCRRWSSFSAFLEDMGDAPAGMTIDRIDGSRGYYKENCRWATPKQQANNTSANRLITHNGSTHTVSEWAEKTGLKANTIIYRLRRGWDAVSALHCAPHKGVVPTVVHGNRTLMKVRKLSELDLLSQTLEKLA